MTAAFDEAIRRAAILAVEADQREGGFRHGVYVASLLAWAARTRSEHGRCGYLDVARNLKGEVVGIDCPAHGRMPPPEAMRL